MRKLLLVVLVAAAACGGEDGAGDGGDAGGGGGGAGGAGGSGGSGGAGGGAGGGDPYAIAETCARSKDRAVACGYWPAEERDAGVQSCIENNTDAPCEALRLLACVDCLEPKACSLNPAELGCGEACLPDCSRSECAGVGDCP